MFNGSWERTSARKTTGPLATVLQIITLGIAASPNAWEVEYTDTVTGKRVKGTGPTETDADDQARMMIAAAQRLAAV